MAKTRLRELARRGGGWKKVSGADYLGAGVCQRADGRRLSTASSGSAPTAAALPAAGRLSDRSTQTGWPAICDFHCWVNIRRPALAFHRRLAIRVADRRASSPPSGRTQALLAFARESRTCSPHPSNSGGGNSLPAATSCKSRTTDLSARAASRTHDRPARSRFRRLGRSVLASSASQTDTCLIFPASARAWEAALVNTLSPGDG